MKRLRMLMALMLLICVGCFQTSVKNDGVEFDTQHFSVPTEGRQTYVSVGTIDNELVFVVICSERNGAAGGIVSSNAKPAGVGSNLSTATIRRPDGKSELLPSDSFIFQQIDGVWSETKHKITLDEWTRFNKSGPEEYSIQKLSEFVGRPLQ